MFTINANYPTPPPPPPPTTYDLIGVPRDVILYIRALMTVTNSRAGAYDIWSELDSSMTSAGIFTSEARKRFTVEIATGDNHVKVTENKK